MVLHAVVMRPSTSHTNKAGADRAGFSLNQPCSNRVRSVEMCSASRMRGDDLHPPAIDRPEAHSSSCILIALNKLLYFADVTTSRWPGERGVGCRGTQGLNLQVYAYARRHLVVVPYALVHLPGVTVADNFVLAGSSSTVFWAEADDRDIFRFRSQPPNKKARERD